MTKRRIIRSDAYNWSIQEWQSGGDVIERGRFAGQTKQAKWCNPEKHYPTLEDAARAFLKEELSDSVPIAECLQLEKLIIGIQSAEQRVTEYVNTLFKEQKDSLLIGILQERGYTVSSGKKGRSSYVEDEASIDGTDSDSVGAT